jgi:hypothetical protein
VPTSRVTIDMLTHQVYQSHVGLNTPEKLKTEKNSKKYNIKTTCTNKKKQ